MGPRVKRVTVRAYNLRPGDILAANRDHIVTNAEYFPGTWETAFVNVTYSNGKRQTGAYADAMITVIREV